MDTAPTELRIQSPRETHLTMLRFDGPIVFHVLLAGSPSYDLAKQEELLELMKAAARRLHGNLSTGLVMKELQDKGIGLRGQVSEAMLLAAGECLEQAGLMAEAERERFGREAAKLRIVYVAKKGLEGMEKGPVSAKIQALSAALLHGRNLGQPTASEQMEAWEQVQAVLLALVAHLGNFAKLTPTQLAILELAGRSNPDFVTDQTAWALVDIAKKSDFTIRDVIAKAGGMDEARRRTLIALGAKMPPAKRGFWRKLLD